jgi:hypothetical protein
MRSPRNTGRIIGILLLAHLITGLTTPYIMLQSVQTPLGFNAGEPSNSFRVRLAVMLLFASGALIVAITTAALPVIRQYTLTLAFWALALAIGNLSLQCVESAAYMSMFTFSQDYARAAGADIGLYQVVGASVRTTWKWVHYTHLLVMVSWMLTLFVSLWRARLVPWVLAAFGVVTTLLQIGGITLPQFLAYSAPPAMLMGVPLAFAYVAIAGWLIVKGRWGTA